VAGWGVESWVLEGEVAVLPQAEVTMVMVSKKMKRAFGICILTSMTGLFEGKR
jgi:hypothetical protein